MFFHLKLENIKSCFVLEITCTVNSLRKLWHSQMVFQEWMKMVFSFPGGKGEIGDIGDQGMMGKIGPIGRKGKLLFKSLTGYRVCCKTKEQNMKQLLFMFSKENGGFHVQSKRHCGSVELCTFCPRQAVIGAHMASRGEASRFYRLTFPLPKLERKLSLRNGKKAALD